MTDPEQRPSAVRRAWRDLWRPSVRWSVASLLIVGVVLGIILWGGFNTAMEATNTLAFCANTCHEMHDNVYVEYQETVHYHNRTGVRAICSDCHVPKDWVHKVARKVKATGELYGHIIGEIDTKEKFEKTRIRLAQNEWRLMKANDSLACRNCHSFTAMERAKQRPRAQKNHATAEARGKTCIDCHKGIAHLLPSEYDESVDEANFDNSPNPPAAAAAPAAGAAPAPATTSALSPAKTSGK
ncbi:MAG TPA: NapC/NirT family cytochrome c [Acidimicrobiia bacterium]|nr:NapC/NirT family cytochrome c [Acidimicrobiia bacterium]